MMAWCAVSAALFAGTPAVAAEPVVADVTVAWVISGHQEFRATWTETGSLRNRVEILRADGTVDTSSIVEADQPNRETWPALGLQNRGGTYRIAVTVVDADGQAQGDPVESPAFDADLLPAARLDAVNPRIDGTVELRWTRRPPAPDDTPGDPLDLPVEDPVPVIPIRSGDRPYTRVDLSGPVAGTSFVVPADTAPPFVVGLRTPNEWGSSLATADVYRTRVTATVPAGVADGGRLRVTGRVYEARRGCDLSSCWPVEQPEPGRTVQLQARTGPDGGWRVVATTRTAADGRYRFAVVSPGPRQYRVAAPPVGSAGDDPARAYAVSAPATAGPGPASGGPATASGGTGGGGLPITGAPVAATAATGAMLVVLGVLLVVAGRRRTR